MALGWVVLYAIALWWVSTGVILLLNHLPQRTFRASLAGATVVLLLAIAGIALTARHATVTAACLGFTCALAAWGFQEMTFFMGAITGPRKIADPGARGLRRMWQAAETLLYHEGAIAAVGVLIVILSAGEPNRTGCDTYLALWLMRISAKFNVYLGVRNLNENWVPRRLAYLKTYMTRRRMNPLLPVCVVAGALAAEFAFAAAVAPGASPFQIAQFGLLGTILALAVLEHVMMVLPLPFASLWAGFSRRCPVGQEIAAAIPVRAATPPTVCPHHGAALNRS